ACVWIPATVEESAVIAEVSNEIATPVFEPLVPESRPLLLTFDQQAVRPADADSLVWQYRADSGDVRSAKYAYIYTAAAMACLPIAPSRDLGFDNRLQNDRIAQVIKGFYRSLDPAS